MATLGYLGAFLTAQKLCEIGQFFLGGGQRVDGWFSPVAKRAGSSKGVKLPCPKKFCLFPLSGICGTGRQLVSEAGYWLAAKQPHNGDLTTGNEDCSRYWWKRKGGAIP